MISNQSPIEVLRIDKRQFMNDLPFLQTKRVKTEPDCLLSTSSEKLNTSQQHVISIVPPNRVSYLPDGRIPVPPQAPTYIPTDLSPITPSVIVETYEEAMSVKLQQFCLSYPISVVRGLTQAVKLNIGLYSSKTLVATQPDHQIEVRTQIQQASDENFDNTSSHDSFKNIWKCESSRSYTTIAKYAQYQVSSFEEIIKEQSNKDFDHGWNGNSKKFTNKTNSCKYSDSQIKILINSIKLITSRHFKYEFK